MSKFVIREVPSGVKFDLLAPNGQSILTSEVYLTRASCRKGIASVQKFAPGANLEDRTEDAYLPRPNPRFEIYRDRSGLYRFRLRSRNGKIIGISQDYAARGGCLGGVESVRKNAPEAEITE